MAEHTPRYYPTGLHRLPLARYLHGRGLEIGGLHSPLLPLPASVQSIRYTDRYEPSRLRQHYPELESFDFVPLDFVSDANRLALAPQSLDFIIANHTIEHVEDFFRVLERFHDSLRPGGVIYMVVPDKRYTFDRHRSVVTFEHLRDEYFNGSAANRLEHYRESVKGTLGQGKRRGAGNTEASVETRAQALLEMDYSIHFHTWRALDFAEHIQRMRRELGIDLWLVDMTVPHRTIEFIVLLQRPGEQGNVSEVSLEQLQARDRSFALENELRYFVRQSPQIAHVARLLRDALRH